MKIDLLFNTGQLIKPNAFHLCVMKIDIEISKNLLHTDKYVVNSKLKMFDILILRLSSF